MVHSQGDDKFSKPPCRRVTTMSSLDQLIDIDSPTYFLGMIVAIYVFLNQTCSLCILSLSIDEDECAMGTDNCSYKCVNEPGGFRCICPKGYEKHGQIRLNYLCKGML